MFGNIWNGLKTFGGKFLDTATGAGLLGQDPEAQKAARKMGLFGMGVGMLQNSYEPLGVAVGNGMAQGMETGLAAGGGLLRQNQAEALHAMRQRVMSKYAVNPNSPMKDQVQSLYGMFMDLTKLGDTDGAKAIGEVLKSVGDLNGGGANPYLPGHPIDPETGNPGLAYKEPGEDGKPKFVPGISFIDPRDITPYQGAQLANKEQDQVMVLQNEYRQERTRRLPMNLFNAVSTTFDAIPLALKGSGTAQLQVVFGYMKMLDPNSVVRESEVENIVTKTASIPQQTWRLMMRLIGRPDLVDAPDGTSVKANSDQILAAAGGAPLLTSATLQDVINLTMKRFESLKDAEAALVKEFKGNAKYLNRNDLEFDAPFAGLDVPIVRNSVRSPGAAIPEASTGVWGVPGDPANDIRAKAEARVRGKK